MTLDEIYALPPVRLEATCDTMTDEQFCDADETLAAALQAAAWKRGYIVARRFGQNHENAVRRANRDLAAVRKVIGYSYPTAAAINV
jgi:hypothetical protein